MIEVEKYLKHSNFDTRQQTLLIAVLNAIQGDVAANLASAISGVLAGGMHLTDAAGNPLATQQDNGVLVPVVKAQAIEDRLDETNMLLRELIETLKGR